MDRFFQNIESRFNRIFVSLERRAEQENYCFWYGPVLRPRPGWFITCFVAMLMTRQVYVCVFMGVICQIAYNLGMAAGESLPPKWNRCHDCGRRLDLGEPIPLGNVVCKFCASKISEPKKPLKPSLDDSCRR